MKVLPQQLRLYAVTDRTWLNGRRLADVVAQAIDGDTAQVGPEIAEHLGLPHISYASAIDVSGDTLTVRQALDDREQVVTAMLPALVTALGGMNQPRYMTPGGIFEAFREKEIRVLRREDVPVDDMNIGLAGSPTQVVRVFSPEARGDRTIFTGTVQEQVAQLVERLRPYL